MANNDRSGDLIGKVHLNSTRADDEYIDRKIYDLLMQNPSVKYKSQNEIAKAIGVTQSGVSKSWRRLKPRRFKLDNKWFVPTDLGGYYSIVDESELPEHVVTALAIKNPFAEHSSARITSNMIGYSLKPNMTEYLEEILRDHFVGLSLFDILINNDKLYVILYDNVAKTTRSFFEELPELVEEKIK